MERPCLSRVCWIWHVEPGMGMQSGSWIGALGAPCVSGSACLTGVRLACVALPPVPEGLEHTVRMVCFRETSPTGLKHYQTIGYGVSVSVRAAYPTCCLGGHGPPYVRDALDPFVVDHTRMMAFVTGCPSRISHETTRIIAHWDAGLGGPVPSDAARETATLDGSSCGSRHRAGFAPPVGRRVPVADGANLLPDDPACALHRGQRPACGVVR